LAAVPQQLSPQAQPSLHCARMALEGHVTLQGPVEPQCTRQEPWHVTSQLPVDVHVTVLWSPTVGAQSFTLVHVYWQLAPHVAPQVLVLSHVIEHASPQVVSQFGPLLHDTVQWSVHVAVQSLPKLLHVGLHGVSAPQFSAHELPPTHAQDEPVHTGPACEEHATGRQDAAARTTANRDARRAGNMRPPSSRPSCSWPSQGSRLMSRASEPCPRRGASDTTKRARVQGLAVATFALRLDEQGGPSIEPR
jgi:hypothetical protein